MLLFSISMLLVSCFYSCSNLAFSPRILNKLTWFSVFGNLEKCLNVFEKTSFSWSIIPVGPLPVDLIFIAELIAGNLI